MQALNKVYKWFIKQESKRIKKLQAKIKVCRERKKLWKQGLKDNKELIKKKEKAIGK